MKAVQAEAGTAEERAGQRVLLGIAQVETWRRLAEVDGTDIPLVVLDAYLKAAQIAALVDPGVRHPVVGARRDRPDGVAPRTVRRRARSGPTAASPSRSSASRSTAPARRRRSTAGTARRDRAAGRCSSSPATWERWGRDGNGDAVVEVQNIYDAARGRRPYLCAQRTDATDDDLRRGLLQLQPLRPVRGRRARRRARDVESRRPSSPRPTDRAD